MQEAAHSASSYQQTLFALRICRTRQKGVRSGAAENIELARLTDVSELVFQRTGSAYLNRVSGSFDIILLDPPYNKGFFTPVLDTIFKKNLLSDGGIIVAETEKDGEDAVHTGFTVIRQAVYGKTVITVLKRGDNQ